MAYRTLNDINKSVVSDVESFIESAEEGFDSSVSSLVGNFISDCDCDIVLLAGPSSSGKTTTAGKIVEKSGTAAEMPIHFLLTTIITTQPIFH